MSESLRREGLAGLATAGSSITRADVHGGPPGPEDAALADRVDGFLSLLAYLAQPEADIVSADRPGLRPVRSSRPVTG